MSVSGGSTHTIPIEVGGRHHVLGRKSRLRYTVGSWGRVVHLGRLSGVLALLLSDHGLLALRNEMSLVDKVDIERWIWQRELTLHRCCGYTIRRHCRNTVAVRQRLTGHLGRHWTWRRAILARDCEILIRGRDTIGRHG